MLKIASPGVPDFYQGSELWDFNLVDPDNRRPVDFRKRKAMLDDIREQSSINILTLINNLISQKKDGKIKLFLIYMALKAKKSYLEIFSNGQYVAMQSAGKFANNVVSFSWRYQGQWALVMVPRFFSTLVKQGEFPLGENIWLDTEVIMPSGAPSTWSNVITHEVLSSGRALSVKDILSSFPVAMLISDGSK
jgi:(1->4)-alpha-D-glucan 1-alpha-D-glucosylmutase